MKALILKILIASGLLNAASLLETNIAETDGTQPGIPLDNGLPVDTKGFPLGYLEEASAQSSSIDSLNIAAFASNWLFWAIVALIGFFVLRWIWDKFSRLVFYVLIAGAAVAYLGSIYTF